jgi:hypothetical protein
MRSGIGAALLTGSLALHAGLAESGLDQKIAALNNVVIRERISRYSQQGNQVHKLESFDSVVNLADGSAAETPPDYSELRRLNTDETHVGRIQGVWSFGEAMTMLRTTRDALEGRALTPGDIRFRCKASDRRWFVMVGTATYWLDFEGSLRVSPVTGDIERIAWTAVSVPREAGVARIEWSVEFVPVEIAGRICTVPKTGIYRILRSGRENRAEWNVTEFSEAGRYGSESVIRFEP